MHFYSYKFVNNAAPLKRVNTVWKYLKEWDGFFVIDLHPPMLSLLLLLFLSSSPVVVAVVVSTHAVFAAAAAAAAAVVVAAGSGDDTLAVVPVALIPGVVVAVAVFVRSWWRYQFVCPFLVMPRQFW